jgi:hypothetical protein
MSREEGALKTHIDPRERKIRESNALVLFVLVYVGFGNRLVDVVMFPSCFHKKPL